MSDESELLEENVKGFPRAFIDKEKLLAVGDYLRRLGEIPQESRPRAVGNHEQPELKQRPCSEMDTMR